MSRGAGLLVVAGRSEGRLMDIAGVCPPPRDELKPVPLEGAGLQHLCNNLIDV